MTYSTNRTIPLKLTTVTPVSIGDGGKLSPFTDYILHDGKYYLIDEEKFQEEFKDKIHLLDYFMQGVKNHSLKDKTKFLKEFIEEQLQVEPFTEVVANKTGYSTNISSTSNATEVSTILKNGRQPFISGSSLKGAIKTALLYDWLLHDGKHKLQNIIYKIKDFSKDTYSLTDKVIDSFLHEEYDNDPRDFHLLQITDTQLFAERALELHETKRFHLKKGDFDKSIRVMKEAIAKGEDTNLILRLINGITHPHLQYLETADWNTIAQKVNQFSLANVKHEIDVFDSKRKYLIAENPEVTLGYEKFLKGDETQTGMLEKIKKASSETAYIALGSGKTYFYNSIGLAILNHSKSDFKSFMKLMKLGNAGQELFPITRALNMDYKPLGWVKLEPK